MTRMQSILQFLNMMTSSNGNFFSALLTICAGTSLAPVTSPHNNRETGDLRRHRAHYDVIVMDDMYRNSITVEIG